MNELVKKRSDIINQFTKGNINTKSKKLFDAPDQITESVKEQKSKEESDRSIPNCLKVSDKRFNIIKQIINENKDSGTTTNDKRYTLNDANDLVNIIAKKSKMKKRKIAKKKKKKKNLAFQKKKEKKKTKKKKKKRFLAFQKNKAINFYNNLMKKVEQISKLRPTQPRQKMLEIFSYLGEISNGPKTDDEQPDTTDKPEL